MRYLKRVWIRGNKARFGILAAVIALIGVFYAFQPRSSMKVGAAGSNAVSLTYTVKEIWSLYDAAVSQNVTFDPRNGVFLPYKTQEGRDEFAYIYGHETWYLLDAVYVRDGERLSDPAAAMDEYYGRVSASTEDYDDWEYTYFGMQQEREGQLDRNMADLRNASANGALPDMSAAYVIMNANGVLNVISAGNDETEFLLRIDHPDELITGVNRYTELTDAPVEERAESSEGDGSYTEPRGGSSSGGDRDIPRDVPRKDTENEPKDGNEALDNPGKETDGEDAPIKDRPDKDQLVNDADGADNAETGQTPDGDTGEEDAEGAEAAPSTAPDGENEENGGETEQPSESPASEPSEIPSESPSQNPTEVPAAEVPASEEPTATEPAQTPEPASEPPNGDTDMTAPDTSSGKSASEDIMGSILDLLFPPAEAFAAAFGHASVVVVSAAVPQLPPEPVFGGASIVLSAYADAKTDGGRGFSFNVYEAQGDRDRWSPLKGGKFVGSFNIAKGGSEILTAEWDKAEGEGVYYRIVQINPGADTVSFSAEASNGGLTGVGADTGWLAFEDGKPGAVSFFNSRSDLIPLRVTNRVKSGTGQSFEYTVRHGGGVETFALPHGASWEVFIEKGSDCRVTQTPVDGYVTSAEQNGEKYESNEVKIAKSRLRDLSSPVEVTFTNELRSSAIKVYSKCGEEPYAGVDFSLYEQNGGGWTLIKDYEARGAEASFELNTASEPLKAGTVYRLAEKDADDEKFENILFRTTDSDDFVIYRPNGAGDPRPSAKADKDIEFAADGRSLTVNSYVNGQITVEKIINEAYFKDGNPTFVFKAEKLNGSDVEETWYGEIEFSPGNTGGNKNEGFTGSRKLTYVFENLPVGDYLVSEMDSVNYKRSSVTNDNNEKSGFVRIRPTKPNRKVTFSSNRRQRSILASESTSMGTLMISIPEETLTGGPVIRKVEFCWNPDNALSSANRTARSAMYVLDGGYVKAPDALGGGKVAKWATGDGVEFKTAVTPVTGEDKYAETLYLVGLDGTEENYTVRLNYFDGFNWYAASTLKKAYGETFALPEAAGWFTDGEYRDSASVSADASANALYYTVSGSEKVINLYAAERAVVSFGYDENCGGGKSNGIALFRGQTITLPSAPDGLAWYGEIAGGAPLEDQARYVARDADVTLYAR